MPGNWFCEVTKVIKSEKHPNADSLSIVTVFSDYKVVTRLDEFKEGDLVAYFAVDSILPETPEFSFLDSKTRKRLRAKRLRGVFSMGLVIKAPEGFNEGDSVEEHYGITRYIPLEERDGYKERPKDGFERNGFNGSNEKNPKNFVISHYDLEPLKKLGFNLVEGEEVYVTSKLHGEAIAFLCTDLEEESEKFLVKSRNFYKREEAESKWWEVILRENYKEKIAKAKNKVFMGEQYGNNPGFTYDCLIEDNKVNRKIRIYDIYDLETKSFFNYEDRKRICNEVGLDMVPELYHGPWKLDNSIQAMVEGEAILGGSIEEGFVIEPKVNRVDHRGRRVKYKYISEKYLLQK